MGSQTQDYKESQVVRATLIPTTNYVAGTVLGPLEKFNQAMVLVRFVKGGSTSMELKVEFSSDDSTYYQETFQAISGGTATETLGEHTFTASGNYRLPVTIKDKFMKISVKGTGTLTTATIGVDCIIGVS